MERLACLKRNKSHKKHHTSNTSTEEKVSPVDETKNNKNQLNFGKSGYEDIALSNFEDSNAISQKDYCHRDSFVEHILKESSNFTQSVIIPFQTEPT